MPMDLYRSGDHYVLHADLPGVDPDSVDVSVDEGTKGAGLRHAGVGIAALGIAGESP